MLGHVSAAETLDVYSSVFDPNLEGAAELLNLPAAAGSYPLSTRENRAEVIELRLAADEAKRWAA